MRQIHFGGIFRFGKWPAILGLFFLSLSLPAHAQRLMPPLPERAPKLEVFGGYSYTRFDVTGPGINTNGLYGSLTRNINSWFGFVADASADYGSNGGSASIIVYGNHFGPRISYRRRNRLGVMPFVETLFGGSRLDTTVRGPGGFESATGSEGPLEVPAC